MNDLTKEAELKQDLAGIAIEASEKLSATEEEIKVMQKKIRNTVILVVGMGAVTLLVAVARMIFG